MKKLNIVVVISAARVNSPRFDDSLLRQISQVDPSIKVTDASTLVAGELQGDVAAKKRWTPCWLRLRFSSGLSRRVTS